MDLVAADDALRLVGVEAESEQQLQRVDPAMLDGDARQAVALRRMRQRLLGVPRAQPVVHADV